MKMVIRSTEIRKEYWQHKSITQHYSTISDLKLRFEIIEISHANEEIMVYTQFLLILPVVVFLKVFRSFGTIEYILLARSWNKLCIFFILQENFWIWKTFHVFFEELNFKCKNK